MLIVIWEKLIAYGGIKNRMDRKAFGKKINDTRKKQGITSDKLSVLCEVNPVFIRQIESGVKLPSLPVLIKICNALHISPDYLLGEDLAENELDYLRNLSDTMKNLTPNQLCKLEKLIEIIFKEEDFS